jgi:hypothetical protein
MSEGWAKERFAKTRNMDKTKPRITTILFFIVINFPP